MSLRKELAKSLVLGILTMGAVMGVPIDPKKIEELMNVHNQTKIEYVVKKDDPPLP